MRSFLKNLKQSLGIDEKNITDYLELKLSTKRTIGVEETKTLKSWANLKPFSASSKLGVIFDAHALTVEAQNSLLKLIEEPNSFTNILLICDDHQKLLPTILSRCQIFELKIQKGNTESISEINLTDPIERFVIIEQILTIKEKDIQISETNDLIYKLLQNQRYLLFHSNFDRKYAKNIEKIHETIKMIANNVPLRLSLENLFINLEI